MTAYKSNTILKLDSNGAVRTWQFEVDGDKWRVITGGPGRKSVVTGWTTCRGKQGRSDVQQADFEANASLDQKLAREYRRTEQELASVPKGPMLAKTYEGWPAGHKVVYSQPKLDGIRALVSEHGAFTREYQRHLNVDHIMRALAPVFAEYPGIQFDGELYNHDFKDDFGRISSIVRKQNPTPAQRTEAEQFLQYHIYDICDDTLPFSDRRRFMINDLRMHVPFETQVPDFPVKVVDTCLVDDADQLDFHYGALLEDGYEGQMVRTNMLYEFDKRSKTLLKRKEFITGEFKLLRIEEGNGNWASYAKKVVFELPDGRECGAGIRGTMAQAEELLQFMDRHRADPKTVTIRHFTPTPDGMPRFPVAIDFHFGGRKD